MQSDASETPPDVLIVGAGPAGLCLARALAALELRVDVVERQPRATLAEPAFDGREIALTHASRHALRELGIWSHIPGSEVAPLRSARVMDGARGFDVDGGALGHDHLGVLVSNHLIRAAAWQAVAAEPRVRVHDDCAVDAVEREGERVAVRLADGRRLVAPLLVAADSRFSQVRRALGVPVAMHDFGKTMLVCRMRHQRPHLGVAREWFGRGQTRALLPLREHLVSMVLTVPGHEAEALMQLPVDAFARDMEARVEHLLGAMELDGSRHAYPLVATWSRRFSGPGFALVGDAAVGMHPVTAHGFNLGLASVERLSRAVADSLERHGTPAHPALLGRYQRQHRAAALPLFLGTGAVVGLFTSDRATVQPLRRAVIAGVARLPPLRRALAATLVDEGATGAGPLRTLRRRLRAVLPPRVGVPSRRTT